MAYRRGYPTLPEFHSICDAVDALPFKQRRVDILYRVLNKVYKLNPRVIGHFITRNSALASFDWKITAFDPKDQEKADRARKRVGSVLREMIARHANTPFMGSTLYEVEYENKGDIGNVMKMKRVWNNADYDTEFSRVYFPKTKSDVDTAESTNFILDQYSLPFTGGIIRSFMPREILRYDMLIENANYLKKLKGILQIVVNGGSTEDQAAAEEAAKTVIRDNYVVTGTGIEMKLNEVVKSGGTGFKDFTAESNADISIACLGQANVSELPANTGSRAALQVQRMVSADIFYQDMIREEALAKRVLLMDYIVNYSLAGASEDDVPYAFRFDISQEQDIEKNAAALETISRFMPVKKTEAYALIGMTIPKPDDDLFNPSGISINDNLR